VGEIKATVSSEKKRLGVEGGSDLWVPPVSKKKKPREKEGVSGVLLGWLLLGPGVGPVAGSSLFLF
jgi:hypothetical protein